MAARNARFRTANPAGTGKEAGALRSGVAPSRFRQSAVSGSKKQSASRPIAAIIVRHSPGMQRTTFGGDKAFDTADFVADALSVERHPAYRPEHDRPPLRH